MATEARWSRRNSGLKPVSEGLVPSVTSARPGGPPTPSASVCTRRCPRGRSQAARDQDIALRREPGPDPLCPLPQRAHRMASSCSPRQCVCCVTARQSSINALLTIFPLRGHRACIVGAGDGLALCSGRRGGTDEHISYHPRSESRGALIRRELVERPDPRELPRGSCPSAPRPSGPLLGQASLGHSISSMPTSRDGSRVRAARPEAARRRGALLGSLPPQGGRGRARPDARLTRDDLVVDVVSGTGR